MRKRIHIRKKLKLLFKLGRENPMFLTVTQQKIDIANNHGHKKERSNKMIKTRGP